MLRYLGFAKWCVVATFLAAAGRAVAGDPLGALTDLIGAFAGTFLLREDRHLSQCYRCLRESPLALMGDGGMACLIPYMFLSGMYGLLTAMQLFVVLNRYGTLLVRTPNGTSFLPICFLVEAVAQLCACYFCWQVWRLLQDVSLSGMYQQPGDSVDGPSGSTSGEGEALDTRRQASPAEPPARPGRLTPFQGTGHHLGAET